MVFGRKKKDEDLGEIRRKAVEKAAKLLQEEEAALKEYQERTAATSVINVAEPPALPKFDVPNIGQYATRPPVAAPKPSPAPVPPATPEYKGLTDESIKELTERYGQFLQGGLNPLDSQYLRFLLLLAILDELRAIRAALDK